MSNPAAFIAMPDSESCSHDKYESTQDELGDTAEATQTHNRNMSFPETKVSDRGIQPSRGEKQRVSIPRTLHRDPPKLLLDEATRFVVYLKSGESVSNRHFTISALNTRDIKIPLKNSIHGHTFIAHMPSVSLFLCWEDSI
jgi:ABC transporter